MRARAVVLALLVIVAGLATAADRATALPQGNAAGKAQEVAPVPQIATPDLAGGPDGFGYIFKDETEAGGPVYSWIDISGATNSGITGDDNYGTVSLPFTFNYYGTGYTSCYVYTNGYITFGTTGGSWTNYQLPYAGMAARSMMAYWDDNYVDGSASIIYYKTTGTTPNRKFAVIWNNCYSFNTGTYQTFEVVLDEATGSITFQYNTMGSMGASATVGMQGATSGNYYLQYGYNGSYLANNRAIKFYIPPALAHNVGVANLLAPVGGINAGATVTPACSVANTGTSLEASYNVRMKVGSFYNQTATVTNHAAGTKQYVTFANFTMPDTGTYAVTCSTELSGDLDNTNDKRTGSCNAIPEGAYKVLMAAAEQMTNYPTFAQGLLDSAYGRYVAVDWWDPRSVPFRRPDSLLALGYKAILTFTDYTYYNNVAFGDTLAKYQELGGGVVVNTFGDASGWGLAGRYSTQYLPVPITSAYFGSQTLGTVYSPGHPVMAGVTALTSSNYNTGATSTRTSSYVTRLADYSGGTRVEAAVFDSANIRNAFLGFFPITNIGPLSGQYLRQISNALRWVVPVRNIGAVAIVAPVDSIVPGSVTPQATVRNFGELREPCKVFFSINSTTPYLDSVVLAAGLPVGVDTTLSFANWTATLGDLEARCSTYYATDVAPSNDVVSAVFTVYNPAYIDVGVTAITAPVGEVDTAATVIPAATVNNYGDEPATFRAFFSIFDATDALVYAESTDIVGLANGASTSATFAEFPKPHSLGLYTTRCSVYIAGDASATNNALGGGFEFTAEPPVPPLVGWQEASQVPLTPSGKLVKDGGWIAWDGLTEKFYISKGYKTGDFYAYEPVAKTWTTLLSVPLGTEAKGPYKGSVGVADGNGNVYMTKGNNTPGFWKYTANDSLGTWTQLADIPLGLSNKKVKGGTDMVYVQDDTLDYVYLLKGYKCEFYRYNVAAATWETLAEAPTGVKNKYDKGSWLAYDETGRKVYAHKAKYMEMYAYSLDSLTWGAMLPGMPLANGQTGKSKKAKDGSDAVVINEKVYTLKGGNTIDFYTYDLETAAWAEKETIPSLGSTAKKKRVKGGGSMATDGVYVFALKGNKTAELWQYGDPTPFATAPRNSGVMAEKTLVGTGFALGPNPLASGHASLRYSLPVAGPAQVAVYDVMGRAVVSQSLALGRAGSIDLDLRSLSAGVYLVKLSSGSYAGSQKLVVQR